MISLIIPNFNKAAHLEATLESAIAQRFVSQIIIVDDASTDGSVELLRNAARRDPRIELVFLDRNHNASYCRNRGLQQATGPYVIFLDSDDLLAPHCAEVRLTNAQLHPAYDAWVFPMVVFRESPTEPRGAWIPRPGKHLQQFLAHRLPWSIMQPLWRREFVVGLGGFDESFVRLQDPEFHTRALLAGARVKCFPNAQADCFYRAFGDDSSDAVALSTRGVSATLHYYRTFFGLTPPPLRRFLCGTLFASLAQHAYWKNQGRLSAKDFRRAADTLVQTCEIPSQRRTLAAYASVQDFLPFHVPGLNRLARVLLGINS